LPSIPEAMYIHPIDISLNGIHWNKWDQRIKNMAKFYVYCVLLDGLKKLEINPSFPVESELLNLQVFCEEETKILY
jgi:hypothetical protein